MPPILLTDARQYRERPEPPAFTEAARNVRATLLIAPQRAPDPPRPGDTPTRPARQQIFQALRIAPIRAVMRDSWWVNRKTQLDNGAFQPRGAQLPFRERANIARRMPEAYGTMFTMEPEASPYPQQLIPVPSG